MSDEQKKPSERIDYEGVRGILDEHHSRLASLESEVKRLGKCLVSMATDVKQLGLDLANYQVAAKAHKAGGTWKAEPSPTCVTCWGTGKAVCPVCFGSGIIKPAQQGEWPKYTQFSSHNIVYRYRQDGTKWIFVVADGWKQCFDPQRWPEERDVTRSEAIALCPQIEKDFPEKVATLEGTNGPSSQAVREAASSSSAMSPHIGDNDMWTVPDIKPPDDLERRAREFYSKRIFTHNFPWTQGTMQDWLVAFAREVGAEKSQGIANTNFELRGERDRLDKLVVQQRTQLAAQQKRIEELEKLVRCVRQFDPAGLTQPQLDELVRLQRDGWEQMERIVKGPHPIM